MVAPIGELRIGTSGFHYNHWRDLFYPRGLKPSGWFEHYAARFDTVEIDNTFYRLPSASTFEAWGRQAPLGFLYALKFSRFGTHMKKLTDPGHTIGLFLERAAHLGAAMGPVLVQLPPRWRVNVGRLEAFLEAAPRGVRWAVEFRDPSWLVDPVFEVLREHGAALCVHDMIPGHPRIFTADWTYIRYHGVVPEGNYTGAHLTAAAAELRSIVDRGYDVYAYFNNDLHGHAVRNAATLRRMLGVRVRTAEPSVASLGGGRAGPIPFLSRAAPLGEQSA